VQEGQKLLFFWYSGKESRGLDPKEKKNLEMYQWGFNRDGNKL
jgi:hypothetical protein